jgi:hypothetical protein
MAASRDQLLAQIETYKKRLEAVTRERDELRAELSRLRGSGIVPQQPKTVVPTKWRVMVMDEVIRAYPPFEELAVHYGLHLRTMGDADVDGAKTPPGEAFLYVAHNPTRFETTGVDPEKWTRFHREAERSGQRMVTVAMTPGNSTAGVSERYGSVVTLFYQSAFGRAGTWRHEENKGAYETLRRLLYGR